MATPFTEKEKAEITRLYRKEKKSIKTIAKLLHKSDKRISAFLRGKSECDCSGKKATTAEDAFFDVIRCACEDAADKCEKLVSNAYTDILGILLDVLKHGDKDEKKISKVVDVRCNRHNKDFQDAVCSLCGAMIFGMPTKLKRLWIENIDTCPKGAYKGSKSSSKKTKKTAKAR